MTWGEPEVSWGDQLRAWWAHVDRLVDVYMAERETNELGRGGAT